MTSWLLSVVGMVFLGVLMDIIAPNGKTNAFIKCIFSIILLYVIIAPLSGFLKTGINTGLQDVAMDVDKNFIAAVNKSKAQNLEQSLIKNLEKEGFLNVIIEISYNLTDEDFKVDNVLVNLGNLVLTNADLHIDKYRQITEIVINTINIEKEKIMFYG